MISDSVLVYIVGGLITLFITGVSIIDRFSRRKLDSELIKALEVTEKSFITALEAHTSQAENRAMAMCALLDIMREGLRENKAINEKLYEVIISDKDWGIKLQEISKSVRDIEGNKIILQEVRNYIITVRDIINEIQHTHTEVTSLTKETNGIFKSMYGRRSKDV